jgi:ABC-type dipeptide/oligopeptide/nickel transport system permease component
MLEILARLGRVVFVACTLLSWPVGLFGGWEVLVMLNRKSYFDDFVVPIGLFLVAILIWAFGVAVRYVLAGELPSPPASNVINPREQWGEPVDEPAE